ncbi:30S ribosomal protein S9 [candidate division TA06 bacterium DG_24]|uniref:Small ribosomal subunit protein uS9 n=3 Tax=Bacteria division TA06 TaxID=1156500 RepID=A0A0S8JRW0_UNCT6|nr:MAG: 30S ribosomal protein S9 [candidate division TA06 bacterium DG_24]KPK70863.1 MAG: 30S ribosomal protein S9 [candidate division TA06 bacterium SM23_40]KPL11580.1 MAG: 30S ribosomal protein S9 [candidate division TA06 bacterium SM1_40]
MALVEYRATGRRKESVAEVRLRPGSGRRRVNGNDLMDYFGRESLVMIIEQPFNLTETGDQFDLLAKVGGGGISGQAGALRLGIARALLRYDDSLRPVLKKSGFLMRDPRRKERMKYGLAKRRKRFQFSKR